MARLGAGTPFGQAFARLAALALALSASLGGCSAPLLPEAVPTEVSAPPRLAPATPSLSSVASYRVTGEGPDGARYGPARLVDATLTTAEPLALGTWTFTVEALDYDDAVMATGVVDYTVDWNDEISELVLPLDGNPGSIGIYVSWDSEDIVGPGDGYGTPLPAAVTVEYSLEYAAGGDVPGGSDSVAVDASDNSAWSSVPSLATGMYLASVRILVDGFVVWGDVRPVSVRSGFETLASFNPVPDEVNMPPNVYPIAAPGEYLPFATTTLAGADGSTLVAYTEDSTDPAAPVSAYGGEAIGLGPWNVRIRAANAWGEQVAAAVDPEAYSFAIHVATTGDDLNDGSADAPLATMQVAVDLAAAFNTFPAGLVSVLVRVAQGTYNDDTNGLEIGTDVVVAGGWSPDFSTRTVDAANTILTRTPPNSPLESVVSMVTGYTGSARVEGMTISNLSPGNSGTTAAVHVAGSGRLALADCVLEGGMGKYNSYGLVSDGGADLVLLRNRVWGGEGATDALGGMVRGVLVDGGSPSVYLASNAIMAREPSGALVTVDAVGVEIVAVSGETVELRMYGNTVVADGDTSLALELDESSGGTIVATVANTILAAPGGASAPALPAGSNHETTDLAALDALLAGDLAAIVDYASFAAMDWTPAPSPEGDALASDGASDPDSGTTDEDYDLSGAARTVPWSTGAMERE